MVAFCVSIELSPPDESRISIRAVERTSSSNYGCGSIGNKTPPEKDRLKFRILERDGGQN